jgi:hypothetical protein
MMLALFRTPSAALQTYRILLDGEMYDVDGAPVLLKADGGVPAGARWITVHPPGHEKGQPVLIQETERGSGVFHVVGGAGGKLNYLKLRGVKSAGDYAKDVREKQAARREAKKQQRQAEKQAGVHEQRQAERKAIDEARTHHEKAFIQEVAQAVGWSDEDMQLPAEQLNGLSDEARRAAEGRHHRDLLGRARQTAELQRRKLTIDADARAAADIGEFEAHEPGSGGLGYAPAYVDRTRDQAGDIAAEARAIDDSRKTDDDRRQATTAKERATKIKGELESLDSRAKDLKVKVLDTAQAIKVLQAARKMRTAQKRAAAAKRAVDRGESKAYVVEVGDEPSEADIRRDVENDLRTTRTRAFLGEIGKIEGYENALGRHIGVGAHNGFNSVSLATAGVGVIDRDVVDVLGIAGAAQAMAHRLRTDLTPEQLQQTADALEQYHVDHYMQRSDEALREAQELEDAARELQAGESTDGHDLDEAREIHQQRQQALGEARRVLGVALGEMEAHAALLTALRARETQQLQLPLGRLATEDAVRRLRAIGLERGDYTIEHAGSEVIARVTTDGMLRVAKPTDRAHLDRVRDSLDIIEGRQDDTNFWPQGVAKRPDLALPPAPALHPHALAEDFAPGDDLHQSIRDHIGSRMADGHAIGDIVRDLHTQAYAEKAGDRTQDYFRALGEVVPLKGPDGKMVENEGRRQAFTEMADSWAQQRHGGRFEPLHAQQLHADEKSIEALHRAFADEPAGPIAFRPVGELTPQDQTALRRHFDQHIARDDASIADLRREHDAHGTREPERETDDMFGRGTNPEWVQWKQRGEQLRQQIAERSLDWHKYSQIMGGSAEAYAAVKDHLRGRVAEKLHEAHNRLRPDAPLRLGRAPLQNHLRHLDAVDPASREKRMAEHREMIDGMRNRTAGRYASGGVTEKLDAARERQAALEQSQLGFFAASETPAAERPHGPEERATLGAAAEHRLSQMAQLVGQNFKPGQPVKVWQPSMTGKFVNQQRAIKLIERNKRLALAQGVGSGKTSMGLGAFAHLQQQGKAKRGLFMVPSIVQGQFGAEASAMLEPGKFKWHAEPGATRAQRLAAYRDPGTHFNVVTHQAFRDDMIHLGAQHAGVSEGEMSSRLQSMSRAERKAWAADVMRREGMDHDFAMIDEGHDLLNRAGKQDSMLANVVDAVTDNTAHYVNASADPVKNDPSEAFDLLRKMDPERYTDRAAFMRRYGVDTPAAKDALRREMAPYLFPGRIESGVKVRRNETVVPLSDAQKEAIDEIEQHVSNVRMARLEGKTHVESARSLSPHSFEGVDPARHEEVARRLADSIGVLRETAVDRAINAHPEAAKLESVSQHVKARAGKPGVIFARSLDAVHAIADRLQREGHRVVTITGKDSAREKAAKRLKFKPEKGDPQADILVASDAGAVGMNAQRGQWLLQYDTPRTAKTHAQRNGRIERMGQKNAEIELTDLVADHEVERRARGRLKSKYALREILTSPLEGLEESGFAAYLNRHRAAHAPDGNDGRQGGQP